MFEYGKGICYQGYRDGQSPILGNIPSIDQVLEDLLILDKTFNYIRVYDTSQHTIDILELIEQHQLSLNVMLSMYLFVEENHQNHPIFNPIDDRILQENIAKNNQLCRDTITLAKKYKNIVFCISVGNEARSIWNVNRVSDYRISELVQSIKKETLQPVTYCEEWVYWLSDLHYTKEVVDFISIHSYPVWNGVGIEQSIMETNKHYDQIKQNNPMKDIVVTEAGWPTRTDEHKIPKEWATINNQQKYVHDLFQWARDKKTIVFVFEAFDELWKGSTNPLDPEKNWGLFFDNRQKKTK